MNSSPAAGTAVPIPFQPVVQAPVPVPAQHPPAPPQLRNTLPGTDPRGIKRAREEGDRDDREPSSEPVVKQARVEPAPVPENPRQALFEAIDAGDTAKSRSLLTQFPALRDAMGSQAAGETPLCRAARKGKIDIVNLLIELGAPVDARACNGSTPLMFAAQAGQLEVIDQLCLSGADPDAVNPSIQFATAMFFAAGAGQLYACKRLASHNANLTAKKNTGETCLDRAAAQGHTAVVNWLLDQGVAIDEQDNLGNTALIRACIEGHLEVAQLLASRNANLTAKSNAGETCLGWAAAKGHTAVVNWLLDQGVAIDEQDNSGNTALIYACMGGYLDVVEVLASRNAHLKAKNNAGETCLDRAAARGHTAVVNWLLDQGVAIDEQNNFGNTALIRACMGGHLGVAQLLASRNANLTAKNNAGETCLDRAAARGHTAVVNWLLDQGVAIDERNTFGNTALIRACIEDHLEVVQLLASRNANLTAKNIAGETCLSWAACRGHKAVVNWLLANGASPDDPDNSQHTPLYHAVQRKHWHLVSLLLEYDVNLLLNSDDGTVLGDAIARGAARDGHYQILLQLFRKDWNKYQSFDYSVAPLESAAIKDLISIFEAFQREGILSSADWLSDTKKSDRQNFILGCTSDSGRRDLLTKKNTLLTHVINTFLEIDLRDEYLNLLPVALSGEENQVHIAQKQHMILFALTSLKNSSRLNKVFSGKQLTAEWETQINAVLAHKLDAMILACQESLHLEQATNFVYLKNLCQRYLDIQGNFRAEAFSKALCKHVGLYQVNADRLTELAVKAFDTVRRKPLDLPSIGTAERIAELGGQQIVESWMKELKKQLPLLVDDTNAPTGFRAGFGRLTQAVQNRRQFLQDRLQALQQQLQQIQLEPESYEDTEETPDDEKIVRLLQQQQQLQAQVDELPRLQEHLHELYAALIFDQWRQINAVLGVALKE